MFSEMWLIQSSVKAGATRKWSQETANVAIVRWNAFMRPPSHSPLPHSKKKEPITIDCLAGREYAITIRANL